MHDQAWRLRELVQAAGGQPTGGQPTGGQPTGGQPAGGQPAGTMNRGSESDRRRAGNPGNARLSVADLRFRRTQAARPRIVTITSGKGGVGKSNVAANLAYCLARAGRKTLLIDADLGMANLDLLLGLTPGRNLGHVVAGQIDLAATLMEGPGGIRFLPGASGLARVANMDDGQRDRLLDELLDLERSADVILFDTGAGISRNVTAFVELADDALVVTTPEPTAITDAYALIKVLVRGGYEGRISVLTNLTANRAEGRAVFVRLAKTVARFLQRTVYDAGSLPVDPKLAAAVRARVPVVACEPAAGISRSLVALSARLMEDGRSVHRAHAPEGLFRRLAGLFS